MSETLPTIKVIFKATKTPMIINEVDFDEKLHDKVVEKAEAKKTEAKKAEEKKDIDDELKNLMGE